MRSDERGSIVVTALLVGLVLAIVGAGLMQSALADLGQADRSQATDMALQAAEAGVNDYVAKLTEDHLYYAHQVHPAESTRRSAGGVEHGPGPWDGTLTWTYPNGRDGGADLGDGFSYSLQVFPPTASRTSVRLVATGWRTGDAGSDKTVEALVRAASIADFQMVSNANIVYGVTAQTFGKVYAGNGANVTHRGEAHADLHAEGTIAGDGVAPVRYFDGATGYDATSSPSIRTVIPEPIDFEDFTDAIGEVERAALAGGVHLGSTADDAWWLRLRADGRIEVLTCPDVDLSQYAAVDGVAPPVPPPPACSPVEVVEVPANGAVYSDQDVIVSGVVRGRVTVATAGTVVIGDDITYAENGVDVLGVIGKLDVQVPYWAPQDLEWWSAALAVDNRWRSSAQFVPAEASHDTIRYHGSTATNLGGYMNQYAVRSYEYDRNLLFLQPPYFPVLEDAYTIELFREVN